MNNLSKYACDNKNAIRFLTTKEDIRPPFFRDSDKIIYSKSFSRYVDKTQVFSFSDNDHITRRITHVVMVSKIARTIGRSLGLNEDLIEAISLGHDSGHCPIGHVGESILNDIAKRTIGESFIHNIQSVRNYMLLEKGGRGLNLSVQVLDGIMCHNGEKLRQQYEYSNKTKEEFLKEYNLSLVDKNFSNEINPMTLEGCVVRISDVIAYVGRDVEDAIALGIIKRKDIPTDIANVLGDNNSDIVNTLILDVIDNSIDKPYVKLSDKVFEKLEKIQKFNYENIYNKANSKEKIEEYKNMFEVLFNIYLDAFEKNDETSGIYIDFLNNMDNEYIKSNKKERIVIDYIAGMTDDYFVNRYNEIKIER